MFKNYFKTAWRSLIHNSKTTFINITGLAVGMTAALFIFLWVQNETTYDNYHKDAADIYLLNSNLKAQGWLWETTPLLLANAIRQEVPEVDKTARLSANEMPVFNINGKLSYEKNCAFVDDDWFSIFHYDFIEGNAASFANDPNSIILSASEAKKYFGTKDPLGKVIHADSLNYVVKAIIKDAPTNSSFQYKTYIPLQNLLKNADRRANDENWNNANYITYIKTRPNVNQSALTEKITKVLQLRSGDTQKETTISLINLKDFHFSTFGGGTKSTVDIFAVLGILLLLIACINYVNLTTAKAGARAKEVSVRKIIGAGKMQLFYQFLSEALLVSIIALAVTLLLVRLCLPVFNMITGKTFLLPLSSASLWKVTGLTLLVAFILNSIYPALVLSSFRPLNVLRGFTLLHLKDSLLRKILVTLQFTISVALIAATIIIYKQMQFIQHSNPGYDRAQVLMAPIPATVDANKKEELVNVVKQQLLAQSSIENVSLANQPIINIGSYSTGAADWVGRDTTFNPKIAQLSTDADYAATMQLKMKEGRWFEKDNKADKHNVILNETAIRELNIPSPYYGQRFTWKGTQGQIIGIVKDFKYKSLHSKTGPLVIFQDPGWYNFFMIRIAPGKETQAIAALQKTWNGLLPGNPLEYTFLDEGFNKLYKSDLQTSSLILMFAIIAVALSCLGLFGLATYTAERRAKEIGIRKVLGATIAGIVRLISTDFIKLVCIAIIIATPVAFLGMNKWMQNFAYRTHIHWWVFALAGLATIATAIITVSFQAIKAAMANPVKSLRSE